MLFSIYTPRVRKWHVSQTHNHLIILREPQGMHTVTGKAGSFQPFFIFGVLTGPRLKHLKCLSVVRTLKVMILAD